jgi:phosphoribosylaminoimidazole-succinocarboxamide synthase
MVYEGKAKILYEGPEPGTLIQYFKDDATAFNAQKKDVIDGKGVLNNRISEHIMTALTGIGVPNHFIRRVNMREQLIRACEIVPLEVIVRNVAAGSLSKRLGIEEGTPLPRPIIEFCYKDDALGDPLVTEEHIIAFNWASQQDIDDIIALALRVNDFLSGLFTGVGIKLVDFKIECGRVFEGDFQRIIAADEISPDSCRLWDIKTGEKLDKDVFRRDLGSLSDAYSDDRDNLPVGRGRAAGRSGVLCHQRRECQGPGCRYQQKLRQRGRRFIHADDPVPARRRTDLRS